MGAFLSEPVRTKVSDDGETDKLSFGVSSMQGWRITMEDAHTCSSDIGESTTMFGVYDGHGGSEVAEYCAKYLPQFITEQETFAKGDLGKCLHDAFLSIDKTIASEEGITELKAIAGDSKEDDEEDEDEAALLEEEATLPIEQLLKRLEQNVKDRQMNKLEDEDEEGKKSEDLQNGDSDSVDADEKKDEEQAKESTVVQNGDRSHSSKDQAKDGDDTKETKHSAPGGASSDDSDVDDEDTIDNDEEDDDEDDDDEDDAEEEDDVMVPQSDECGMESGTTANVALIRGSKLVVANAGDSRCVLCRAGKAVDMSVDHKPEDEIEKQRILLAGGRVTADGRVNGGLNLSRALGDHAYKQEENLAPEQQAISPAPDVKEMALSGDDEFLVLACDGIWNVKESQEVVDFIRKRLHEQRDNGKVNLSKICEELLDDCIAPDSSGDGSGCDNMTCIIVTVNKNCLTSSSDKKREREDVLSPNKKTRTE